MKKFISVFLVILTVSFILPVSAFADVNTDYIYDEANALTNEEKESIDSSLAEFSKNRGIETKIFLTTSPKGTELIFDAENIYSENGMNDGLLLLIDCAAKNSAVFSGGEAHNIFDEYKCKELSFTVNDAIASKGLNSALYGFIAAAGSQISGAMVSSPNFNGAEHIPKKRLVPRLVDNACLLSSSEEKELVKLLDSISSKHSFDVAIATVDYLDSRSPTAFADDWYDYNGYNENGILFLISMGERDWAISTTGTGIAYFTDAGQEVIIDDLLKNLSKGRYDKAFTSFANSCDKFLKKAESGKPYDVGNLPKGPMPVLYYVVCVIISVAAGFTGTSILKGQLQTVAMQDRADSYTKKDSFHVPEQRDLFLFSTVTKSARPKNTSSSGSRSGGGSSSRSSSSGRSHGGSSGKF